MLLLEMRGRERMPVKGKERKDEMWEVEPVYGETQKTFLLSPQDRWDSGSLAGPSSLAGTPTSARLFSRSPILPLLVPPHYPVPPPFQEFVHCNPYRLTHRFTLPGAPSTLHAISLPHEVDLNLQPHRSPSPNTSGSQTLACIRTIWRACDTQIVGTTSFWFSRPGVGAGSSIAKKFLSEAAVLGL